MAVVSYDRSPSLFSGSRWYKTARLPRLTKVAFFLDILVFNDKLDQFGSFVKFGKLDQSGTGSGSA
jgi:hypothetical protein